MPCPVCGDKRGQQTYLKIMVATDAQLANPHYLYDLKKTVANDNIPRRRIRDVIADAICRFRGIILGPDFQQWNMPDIDDVFPDDPDQRWVSRFLQADPLKSEVRVQARVIERIRFIDLYARITHPQAAKHFGVRQPANDNWPLGG